MHTITTGRAETASQAIRAAPDAVFRFLAEPQNLPRWAPAFAQDVRRAGDELLVVSGEAELRIAMRSCAEPRTVDLVAATDRTRGAFMRVVPNGEGAECLFTTVFAPGTLEEAVTAQMAVIAAELDTVRAFVEGEMGRGER